MTEAPDDAAVAPDLPGYSYVRPIGHGGFSDVYLYEQSMPRRQVAIKVLRTEDLSEGSREQFAAEANLMARVSNHSNIAAIYAADVDEDGQPYLVMEFCSGGSLGAFYRHYPMSVKDVLSLGIRLSGALEAAHRAGIVHRDIKPANILLTEYGVPVLSDFGISTIDEDLPETTRQLRTGQRPGTGESSIGMSLPWTAPETLWDIPVSDARSDRYSLAATLFSLLEGRSPHEVPGGPNSAAHLTGRIQSGFVGAMKRPDIPPSLHALLRRGLSHDRSARFDSAADLGRALQDVQRELGIEVTPLEVPRGEAPARPPEPSTRVHQAQPIQLPEGHATLLPQDPGPQVAVVGQPPQPVPQQLPPQHLPPQPLPQQQPAAMGSASYPTGPGAPQGPTTSQPAAFTSGTAWPTRPPRPWDLPPGAQLVGATTTQPSGSALGRWRVAFGVLMGVLVLGCVVVASLLIARANADPTYTGPAIDHLTYSENAQGVYTVDIPEALPIPTEIEARVIERGDGEALTDTSYPTLSSDSSEWDAGGSVLLNPMESANQSNTVFLSTEEMTSLIGDDVAITDLHQGDVLLLAAPVGYFANSHPELGVNYSDATLVIVTITDVT